MDGELEITQAPAGLDLGDRIGSRSARPRTWRRTNRLLPPLVVFLAAAILQLTVLQLMTRPGGPGVRERLLSWDAVWYIRIAADGYPAGWSFDAAHPTGNELAFLPLFPMLVRAVHLLTSLTYDTSALVAALLGSAAAAVLVHELVHRLHGPRAALPAVALVATQPMAVVLLMGYAEGLFLALAAGALLAAQRQAWLWAGACGFLAGLTRSGGAAVGAAVVVAVACELWRRRSWEWLPVTAAALACAGVPAYVLWVASRVGRLDAWFEIQQAGWGTRLDWGAATRAFLGQTVKSGDQWVAVSTAVMLLVAMVMAVVATVEGVWPPLCVYGWTVLVLTLGQSNYYHSKLRLLVPALLGLLPVAAALGRARPRTALVVLGALALFGTWYGAYMVTVWPYAV